MGARTKDIFLGVATCLGQRCLKIIQRRDCLHNCFQFLQSPPPRLCSFHPGRFLHTSPISSFTSLGVTLWAAEIFWGKFWQEKKHVGVSDLVPKKCRYFSTHKNKEGEENFWDQQCRLRQIDGFQFENPVCAPPPALPVSPFRSAAANLPHRGAADPPLRPAPLPALQLPPPHPRAAAAASQPRPPARQLGRGGRAGGGRNCHAGRSPPAQQRWVQPATHLRMCVTKYGSWDESPD